MPLSLTKQELKLLSLLQSDATLSIAELAQQSSMSTSPCWRRINRLQADGVIRKRVALLDPKSLGLTVVVFAEVKLNAHTRHSLDTFAARVHRFPEVLECHAVVGDVDFLLKIMTRDIESYQHFVYDQLSQLEEVREVKSLITLNPVKATTQLPLNQVAAD